MPDLTQWDSFYVIVGSAAGALIGLQFVVMTLMADSPTQAGAQAGEEDWFAGGVGTGAEHL